MPKRNFKVVFTTDNGKTVEKTLMSNELYLAGKDALRHDPQALWDHMEDTCKIVGPKKVLQSKWNSRCKSKQIRVIYNSANPEDFILQEFPGSVGIVDVILSIAIETVGYIATLLLFAVTFAFFSYKWIIHTLGETEVAD